MQKQPTILIFSTPAYLWRGTNRFSGVLELWETAVVFQFSDFQFSYINLSIPFSDIEKIEEYLIFDLAQNGLRILGKEGKYDLFVLEDIKKFKNYLLKTIEKKGLGN